MSFSIGQLPDKMPSKITIDQDGCWIWSGNLTKGGYGQKVVRREDDTRFTTTAHRASWIYLVGPIKDGDHLDHLCHTLSDDCDGGDTCKHRRCINPAHLEPVSPRENLLRSGGFIAANLAKTHCPQGHPYSSENTYPPARGRNNRRCKICARVRAAACRKRNKGVAA